MPTAKKSTRSSSRARATFKEPAALKRLHSSLDAAQKALGELREHAGRDAAQSTRDLQKDLRAFLSSARRDSGKLSKALARDFQRAQKLLADTSSRSKAATSRRKTRSSTPKRSSRKST
jgi:hypothetical protein